MNTKVKAIKGTTTLTTNGFKTTHYYKSQFVGESNFNMKEHFGWTRNEDGTVTIAANKVDFNVYGLARGMGESLTNAYASAKTEGLMACIATFKERLKDLYNGVVTRTGAKKSKVEEIDLFKTTLAHVMMTSLIKEYKVKFTEAQALAKSIDFAAVELGKRTGKDSKIIRESWINAANAELAALSEELPEPTL
jgi:hypothetical protein